VTQAALRLDQRRRSTRVKCSADEIRAALRKHFREPAHVVLEEVRNRTGHGRTERYADALVCSVWPSRGLWFAGVEIKISRSDWQRELDGPEKSAEIQRFCQYWWVAAPVGLIGDGQVPATWGLLEYDGKHLHCMKEAPQLEAQSPTAAFVCSVLRNAARAQQELFVKAEQRGRKKAETECSAAHVRELELRIHELEGEQFSSQHLTERGKEAISQLAELRQLLDAYGFGSSAEKFERCKKRLRALREFERCDLTTRAQQLREAAALLDEAASGAALEVERA
jgi:hypothetical protein